MVQFLKWSRLCTICMTHQMSLVGVMRYVGHSLSWGSHWSHMSRANYQAKVWLQADRCHMSLGSPADSVGWDETNGVLKTAWTRKPSVPESYLELVTCKCDNSQCRTLSCKCVQSGQICLPACGMRMCSKRLLEHF